MNVELTTLAARQLVTARDWWLENRNKAPHTFDEDLSEFLLRLESRADLIGRPVAHRPGVRRAYLHRIRYDVYFQVLAEQASVQVLAI